MIPEVISFVGTIFSGLCLVWVAQINKKSDIQKKDSDIREEQHKRQYLLQMEMIEASIELGDINAISLQQGKLNGNVEEARKKAKDAREKYHSFLADIASEVV